MRNEDREMMKKIMDTERVGYAYFYPRESEGCEVYYISTSPENIANFIGSHFHDANRMAITDIVDRLILTTFGGFIADCPDQNLCMEIILILHRFRWEKKKQAKYWQLIGILQTNILQKKREWQHWQSVSQCRRF